MINFVKANEEMPINLPIEEYDSCYKLVKDNETIGFGTINKNKENALFIFIQEEQRGNGYGKLLFSKMLEETKNIGYDQAKISFNRGNMPMLKIATDNGGLHISSDGDTVKYVIPIK